jgi:hypothetical protein
VNFREFLFRNCLENRSGSRIGTPRAAKRGRRRLDRPLLAAKNARLRRLQLFSKQFLPRILENEAKDTLWASPFGPTVCEAQRGEQGR